MRRRPGLHERGVRSPGSGVHGLATPESGARRPESGVRRLRTPDSGFGTLLLLACCLRLPAGESDDALAAGAWSLMAAKCLACHGEDAKKIKGGLDLRTRAAALKGGESGRPAIVPGDPAKSLFHLAVTWSDGDLRMPPKENARLTAAEVAQVTAWITAGAPWPGAKPAAAKPAGDGVTVRTSGGLAKDWDERPYAREDLWAWQPLAKAQPPAPGHPIDAFIDQALKAKGLAAAPAAAPAVLARRLHLDLTGLPPTTAEAAAINATPAGWEAAIDRLLASPRYGERMAQHWLDVVRYADSNGYSIDAERPTAWRYRDHVVDAFNRDQPYDRFVVEQIAGDELAADDPAMKVAVGFLRMGPWEHTAMSVAAVTRQQFLDDVTNAVGVTFLAQGLSCCKCHDHKFDPIPTRDYYRVQAVFAATYFAEPPAPHRAHEGLARFPGERGPRTEKSAQARHAATAFSVRNGKAESVRILTGGALDAPTDAVAPGALSAVAAFGGPDAAIPATDSGRRLALARWIADARNPLTARVMVNRVWQMHFGTGLVATPNNFGRMGRRPSHPALLDWLAARFIADGWSLKKLHRLILTSAAYRRSSLHADPAALRRLDPADALLARFPPRRLGAEEIRDGMLAITGELNTDLGGPPVHPEIDWEVALQPRLIMGKLGPPYLPSALPATRHRRTLYAVRYRNFADPLLEVFDRPGCEFSCERRDQTTVPTQALTLFNSRFVHDRALALAVRLDAASGEPGAQVDAAFQAVYGRAPTPAQRARGVEHLRAMLAHHEAVKPVPVKPPTSVVQEVAEEKTGAIEKHTIQLDAMKDFVPDRKPWDVTPRVRALAELCLVLFNSNEFLHVD